MLAVNNLCSAFRQRNNSNEIASLLEESMEMMRTEWHNLDMMLVDLDVKDYTIVHAAVYYHKLCNTTSESELFVEILLKIQKFIRECCKTQIRTYFKYFINMMAEVSKKAGYCNEEEEQYLAVCVCIEALMKFQKDSSELTPIHDILVQLVLFSKHFDICLAILDEDILDIHKSVDSTSYESYYYFGGMVYLAVKQYERAQFFMELCLFNPSNQINKIVKEAYKKYCLISLINADIDRINTIDKPLFNSRLDRQFRDKFKLTYIEFMSIFLNNNINNRYNKLMEFAEAQRSIFERDANYGLVKQCLRKNKERQVLQMTKIYVSLMLSELTSQLGYQSDQQTRDLLFSMICRGLVRAKIDEKNGLVEFMIDEMESSSPATLELLQIEMDCCINLQTKLHKLNDKMSIDQLYLRKILEKELSTIKS